MSNYHNERWLIKSVSGFLLTAGGIFFMYYCLTHFGRIRWETYGLISGFGVAIGVFLISSAAVHKVKADLIKKQKLKQQSG
jgi:hypothetical protein